MTTPLRAEISLASHLAGRAGADRIALLEAIGETGSISAAARQVGLSYRAAWDAVQVLNNLFASALVTAGPGGAKGGGASVTAEGLQVIAAFRAMEADLQRMLDGLKHRVAGDAALSTLWALNMKISTRNALHGVVTRVVDGAVNAEVVLKIGAAAEIVAVVTRQSVADLGLAPDREAIALINPAVIILARIEDGDGVPSTSARNALTGMIVDHQTGAVNDEVSLDIGDGKTLTATVTTESAKTLGLEPGARAIALIKASHVILATA